MRADLSLWCTCCSGQPDSEGRQRARYRGVCAPTTSHQASLRSSGWTQLQGSITGGALAPLSACQVGRSRRGWHAQPCQPPCPVPLRRQDHPPPAGCPPVQASALRVVGSSVFDLGGLGEAAVDKCRHSPAHVRRTCQGCVRLTTGAFLAAAKEHTTSTTLGSCCVCCKFRDGNHKAAVLPPLRSQAMLAST